MADDLVGRTWDCRASDSAHSFTARAYLPSGGRLRGCDRCVRGRPGWMVRAYRLEIVVLVAIEVGRRSRRISGGLAGGIRGRQMPAVLAGPRAYAQPRLGGHDLVWLVARSAKTVSEG
jgi:hypothetical protein